MRHERDDLVGVDVVLQDTSVEAVLVCEAGLRVCSCDIVPNVRVCVFVIDRAAVTVRVM